MKGAKGRELQTKVSVHSSWSTVPRCVRCDQATTELVAKNGHLHPFWTVLCAKLEETYIYVRQHSKILNEIETFAFLMLLIAHYGVQTSNHHCHH